MDNNDIFEIARAINKIAMLSDDETLEKIKPSLEKIEDIVAKYAG